MNATMFEFSAAIFMVAVCAALIVWFIKYMGSTSERRMVRMLKRVGLDPNIANEGSTDVVVRGVRCRCRNCPSEDLCERWLAGEVEGENTFCPNALIFRILKRATEHAA